MKNPSEKEAFGKLAEEMTDAFFQSADLAEGINDLIVKLQPSPASVVMAALVIDRFLDAQIRDWDIIKATCAKSFAELAAAGILPTTNADGSFTDSRGRNSRDPVVREHDELGTVGRESDQPRPNRKVRRAAKKKGDTSHA